MFSSSPAAVGWHPLHSNECMTLTGSHHPQGPADTSVRLNFRMKAIRLFPHPHIPRPWCKKQLSASNVAIKHITQGKYSDGLHPGDTSKGSPNWHSFFQKQHLPAPGLITLPHQHKTQKTMLHPLEFSSKSQSWKAKPPDISWKCAWSSTSLTWRDEARTISYPSNSFCTKSRWQFAQHFALRLPPAL